LSVIYMFEGGTCAGHSEQLKNDAPASSHCWHVRSSPAHDDTQAPARGKNGGVHAISQRAGSD
jgi:hypothetical protein